MSERIEKPRCVFRIVRYCRFPNDYIRYDSENRMREFIKDFCSICIKHYQIKVRREIARKFSIVNTL